MDTSCGDPCQIRGVERKWLEADPLVETYSIGRRTDVEGVHRQREGAGFNESQAAIYLFNPVTWYDSAIWGQVDAFGALLSLATVALLIDGHAEAATAMAVLAGLAKPQYGVVLVPILAVVLLRRHLFQPGSGPRVTAGPRWYRTWSDRETGIWRLVSSAAVGASLLFVVTAPFGMDLPRLIVQYGKAAGTYPFLTVNALNPWALIGAGDQAPMAEAGFGRWPLDTMPLLGPIPGVMVGTALLAIGFLIGLALLARRGDRTAILLATAYLCLAFFVLPTRVHERYLFPVFALLPRVYDWLMQLRIRRLYDEMKAVERELVSGREGPDTLNAKLDRLYQSASELKLPAKYASMQYTLRMHLDLVRARIAASEAGK